MLRSAAAAAGMVTAAASKQTREETRQHGDWYNLRRSMRNPRCE